jgi:hypothetical protein
MMVCWRPARIPRNEAETHFQNALALIAEGDTARASVEFRNVFQNNGFHRDARARFAAMLRARAMSSNPMASICAWSSNIPTMWRRGSRWLRWPSSSSSGTRRGNARRAGHPLAPDDPASRIISVNLAYLDAVEAEDAVAREAADRPRPRRCCRPTPDNLLLQRLVIDGLVREGASAEALALLDGRSRPSDGSPSSSMSGSRCWPGWNARRRTIAALREMMVLFPEDEQPAAG